MEELAVIWVFSVILTTLIAAGKGQAFYGFILACLFGPLAIVIAIMSSTTLSTTKRATNANPNIDGTRSILGNDYVKGDEDLYLKVTQEIEHDEKDVALWSKALVLAEGDEDKAKYHYIKIRVGQLTEAGSPTFLWGGQYFI